jgi:hypothetical protein
MTFRRALTVAALLGIPLVLGWTIAVFVLAYWRSHPPIDLPSENRARFADVGVLLDATGSMSDSQLEAALWIVVHGIVPAIGLEDRFVAYGISPRITLESVIAGRTRADQPDSGMPGARERIVRVLDGWRKTRGRGAADDELRGLLRDLAPHWARVADLRRGWTARLERLERPTRPGSEICAAIRIVLQDLAASADPHADLLLFVISDLEQVSRTARHCTPLAPDLGERVRITLIVPTDSDRNQDHIGTAWDRFFGDRVVERVSLSNAQRQETLLSPNPLAGLEHRLAPGFLESLVPLLRLEASVLGALGLAGGLVLAVARRFGPPPHPRPVGPAR